MKLLRHHLLLVWAVRNLARHPARHLLLFAAVLSLVTICSMLLFFYQALSETTLSLLGERPALVVRRLTSGGWAPIPEKIALDRVRTIPGILNPRSRIWGTVRGPQGAVTIVADTGNSSEFLSTTTPLSKPMPGEVWVGHGVTSAPDVESLELSGYHTLELSIKGRFDRRTDMATHGLVLVNAQDARYLLGIPPGHASDLAIDVFHAEEAEAVQPELVGAFPWPVQISSRESTLKFYNAYFARQSGFWMLVLIPTLLALVLITASLFQGQIRFKSEMGLLKALGWTSGDIARYHFYRAGAIGLTASIMGIGLAYALVFWPGVTWPNYLFLSQSDHIPALYLGASGIGKVIVEIVALIVVPFLVAAYWATLQGVGADPADLLEEGHWQ
jgi:hypothetical protein